MVISGGVPACRGRGRGCGRCAAPRRPPTPPLRGSVTPWSAPPGLRPLSRSRAAAGRRFRSLPPTDRPTDARPEFSPVQMTRLRSGLSDPVSLCPTRHSLGRFGAAEWPWTGSLMSGVDMGFETGTLTDRYTVVYDDSACVAKEWVSGV